MTYPQRGLGASAINLGGGQVIPLNAGHLVPAHIMLKLSNDEK